MNPHQNPEFDFGVEPPRKHFAQKHFCPNVSLQTFQILYGHFVLAVDRVLSFSKFESESTQHGPTFEESIRRGETFMYSSAVFFTARVSAKIQLPPICLADLFGACE